MPKNLPKDLWMNDYYRLMWKRMRDPSQEESPLRVAAVSGIKDQAERLLANGGFAQQNRMIRDKRRSLDRAVLYSYQAAWIKKVIPDDVQVMDGEVAHPVRALINPNKLKQDYDEKIVSVGWEHGFQPGDVFEWCNTRTHWIIYLQELSELAYFRGQIRKCCYYIEWVDDEGNKKGTYAAIRGPIETRINFNDKHSTILDNPNYSLHLIMPRNPDTMKQFRRYSKFYLQGADAPDNKICWRVEATDSISSPGILELEAVEYYANPQEDDVEQGLVGVLIDAEQYDPNPSTEEEIIYIVGETFIKPKMQYMYTIGIDIDGQWHVDDKVPVDLVTCKDEHGNPAVKVTWRSTYSGEFVLKFNDYEKTIVVETLF